MSIKLKNNKGLFYVPFDDYLEQNKPLWYVDYRVYEIIVHSENHLHFGYDEEGSTGWGDIYAELYIKKGKYIIKGKGSRHFRKEVIKAYEWFIKAKNDERYRELFCSQWFE